MPNQLKYFFASFTLILASIILISGYIVKNTESIAIGLNLPIWSVYIIVAAFILVPVVLGFVMFRELSSISKLDETRKEDLEKLKYGFRAFFQDHGYYPTSDLDSKPKDIIIPTDWNKYQFPSHEIMWKYVKRWPLHDPTFDVKKPIKSNQYLYRLTDDGKHFAVYARLGNASDKEAKDYNKLDKIDPKLGVFNYKVSF